MSGGGRPGLTAKVNPVHISNHVVIIKNAGDDPLDEYLKRGLIFGVQFPDVTFRARVLVSFPDYVALENLGHENLISKITPNDVVNVHFFPIADSDDSCATPK